MSVAGVGCFDEASCVAGLVGYIRGRARKPATCTSEQSGASDFEHAEALTVSRGELSNANRCQKGYPTALVIDTFEQSLQRWFSCTDEDEEFLRSQGSSQDRVKLRRARRDKLLEALQGASGASLKEACRLADIAGVDNGLINQAWAKARAIMFQEELRYAMEDSDVTRLERACRLASEVEVDEDLVAKGEREVRRMNAKKKASNALLSGDIARIERACRQAELAGVDNSFLAPIIAESLRLRAQKKQHESTEQVVSPLAIAGKAPSKTCGHRTPPCLEKKSEGRAQVYRQSTCTVTPQKLMSDSTKRRSFDNDMQRPKVLLRRSPSGAKAMRTSSVYEADSKAEQADNPCEVALLSSLVERGLLCAQSKPRGQNQDDITSVASMFSSAVSGAHVLSVMRIENSNLIQRYDAIQNTTTDSIERELWHGTSEESAHNIIVGGFNRAYCGRHGTRFGNGTYFSTDATYSARFCEKKGRHSFMFLAKVLVGQWVKGEPGLKEPPYKDRNGLVRYDSTVDDVDHPTIFCIFHDFQAVPLYLVEFET